MQRINDDIVTHTSDKINVDKKSKDKKLKTDVVGVRELDEL